MIPSRDRNGAKSRKPTSAVDQVLLAVQLFATQSKVNTVELSDLLGVPAPAARRAMAHLVRHGLAAYDAATDSYSSTGTHGDTPPTTITVEAFVTCARPSLDYLARKTGETVHLGVRDGLGVRFLAVIESNHALRVSGRVGQLVPVHATSMGKAMLATMSNEQISALLPDTDLPRLMPRTKTTRVALIRELARIRNQGYAVNREESELGVGSVGVAVINSSQRLLGALSVAAPIDRMTEEVVARHAALLLKESVEIARQLD